MTENYSTLTSFIILERGEEEEKGEEKESGEQLRRKLVGAGRGFIIGRSLLQLLPRAGSLECVFCNSRPCAVFPLFFFNQVKEEIFLFLLRAF